MKISEFIKSTYVEHPYPRLFEIEQLAFKYESTAQNDGASFLQTFSTSFFPRLITNSKHTERCIVWDNHFWDLFERFLLTIIQIEEEMNSAIAYECFTSIYTLFLSARFYKIPDLSLIFAKRYEATNFFVPSYNVEDNVRGDLANYGFIEQLLYCKDFVFFHELHHVRYQLDEKTKLHDFEVIIKACHRLKNTLLPQETKDIILKLLKMPDKSILEELCCDVNSICCIAYIYSGGKKYDKTIAENIIKSMRVLLLFINTLKKIDSIYKKRYETSDFEEIRDYSLGDSYIEFEIRNYVSHYMSAYLMGVADSDFDTNMDFFTKDECYYKYLNPYYDILSFEVIENIFNEVKLYKQGLSQEECKTARDAIIGWHKANY